MTAILCALLLQQELVERYLAEADSVRRVDLLRQLKEIPLDNLERLVRTGGTWSPPEKTGAVITRTTRTDHGGVGFEYQVYVPPDYDPSRAYRLLITLHGWGDRETGLMESWRPHAEAAKDLIVAAPWSRKHIWAGSRAGHSHVLTTMREVMRDFHVDPDRVYLDGFSTGARGAFDVAAYYPHLFAAIAPRSALPRTSYVGSGAARSFDTKLAENYRTLPVYWVFGRKDPAYVKGVLDAVLTDLKAHCPDFTPRERDAGHEWFDEESPAILRWLAERARPAYPSEFRYVTFEKIFTRAYWIEIAKFAPMKTTPREHHSMSGDLHETRQEFVDAARVRAKIDREHNRIELLTDHVRELSVRLHDRMLDLDRPVEVLANGTSVTKRKVERSAAVLLESARNGDRSMLFTAEITVKIP